MNTAALALLLSGCTITLDVPRGGCLNYRHYAYQIPNPYRSGSLGEVSGTSTYVGARPSSPREESKLLLADPATHTDEKIAERQRSVSHVLEGIGGALIGIALAPALISMRRGWSEADTVFTATSVGVGGLSWGISYAVMMRSKKHAERARRTFNEDAAATGSCPPAR